MNSSEASSTLAGVAIHLIEALSIVLAWVRDAFVEVLKNKKYYNGQQDWDQKVNQTGRDQMFLKSGHFLPPVRIHRHGNIIVKYRLVN